MTKHRFFSLPSCHGDSKSQQPEWQCIPGAGRYGHQYGRGGPEVGSLPANAGDMGSIPDQGRSHIPRGNQTHVTIESVPWSLGAAVTETRALDRVHCNEKPPRREAAAHLS